MDPPPKKVSLFEYKQKRDSSTALPSTSPDPISTSPISSSLQCTEGELEAKLGLMLDKNMALIPDLVSNLPALMRSESKESSKISILNFILNLNVPHKLPSFSDSQMLRDVIYNWLKICLINFNSEMPENKQVLMLIFDLLARITFSQEFLKNSKYLKVMSKLTEVADEEVASKANEFFHAWNRIIAMAPSRQQQSTNNAPSDIFPVRPANSGASAKGGRLLASNLHPSRPQEPPHSSEGPNKSSHRGIDRDSAVEGTASSFGGEKEKEKNYSSPSPTATTTTSRPLTADEIIREKRKKQTLSEGPSSGKRTPRTKRVSFASDELLVQIKYFEIDQDCESSSCNSIHRGRASYHEAEREEASFALKRLAQVNTPQLAWRNPDLGPSVEVPPSCRIAWGSKSIEAKVQQERERRVLSVTYYGNQPVPPSPAEPEAEAGVQQLEAVPRIPLYDVKAQGPGVSGGMNIDSDALLALVHNPELMKRLQSI